MTNTGKDAGPPVDRPLTEPSLRRLPPDTPRRDEILAAHAAAVKRGEPGYIDPLTGLYAMTALGLITRGTCCTTGCRHCPWTQ